MSAFLNFFNKAGLLTKPLKATKNDSKNQSIFKILFFEILLIIF